MFKRAVNLADPTDASALRSYALFQAARNKNKMQPPCSGKQ